MTEPLVHLIVKNFVARKEFKAQQNNKGEYHPVRVDPKDTKSALIPWSTQDFLDHTTHRKTFGHYMLDANSNVKFFMFDIDLKKNSKPTDPEQYQGKYLKWDSDRNACKEVNWLPCDPRVDFNVPDHPCIPWFNYELRWLAEGLARKIAELFDIQTLIEFSGSKGLHVYGLTGLVPAAAARQGAEKVLNAFGCFEPAKGNHFYRHTYAFNAMEIEVFPKQDTVEGSGFGNLVKLPCGIHRKTGRESYFVKCVPPEDEFTRIPLEEALLKQPWE